MLGTIVKEIKKLPPVVTRQQVLNWFDRFGTSGICRELTTGEVIFLIERTGRKVQGQSKLAIRVTEAEEGKFKLKRENRNNIRLTKIPDSEKEKVRNMYWNLKMNMSEIAKEYKCSSSTVMLRMRDWKIPIRTKSKVIS